MLFILIFISLSGCNTAPNGGGFVVSANLVMNDYSGEGHWDLTKGYYATINFIVKNTGSASASNGFVSLYSTDQDGEVESNDAKSLPNLSPGEVHGVSFTVDYEMGDTLLNNKITISWSGGSNEYSQVINL